MSHEASQPAVRWYSRQRDVLEQIQLPDGSYQLKSGFKVCSRDAPWDTKDAGKKEYALVPWSVILRMIAREDCENWYEHIPEGTLVRLVFDMDGELDSDKASCCGFPLAEVRECWRQVVAHCQAHADRLELNVNFETVVLDACGKKFSQHLIMRAIDRDTGKEVFFKDMTHAGSFMRTAFVEHRGDFPEWIISIIDFAIYTRNRVFRFLMAKKKKPGAVKLDIYYPPLGEDGHTRASLARLTTVQPAFLPAEEPRLIECRDLFGEEAKSTSKGYESLCAYAKAAASRSVGGFLEALPPSDSSSAAERGGAAPPRTISQWRPPTEARHPRNTIYMVSGPAQSTVLTGYNFAPNIATILGELITVPRALPDPNEMLVLPGDIDLFNFFYSFDRMPEKQRQAVCLIAASRKRIIRNEELERLDRISLAYLTRDIPVLNKSLGNLCADHIATLTGSSTVERLNYKPRDPTKPKTNLYFAARSHKCAIAGREHRSNHAFFVFSLYDITLVQRCHDGLCAGMRPVKMILPGYLFGALFLAKQLLRMLDFC